MQRRLRLALLVCAAVVAAASSAFAQKNSKASASGTAGSYRKGYETVQAGLKALGGDEALRAAEDVWVKVSGSTWARNQSVRVAQPWDKVTRDETLFADLRRNRFIFENRDPAPGGFVFGAKVVVKDGQAFAANDRDRLVQQLNPANLPGITLNYVRRVPHLLLALASEQRAPTLRYAGEETFDGRPHRVVAFAAANGALLNLFFDAKTSLLSKYEQMVSDGTDGDVVQETIFNGYRAVNNVMVPSGRQTRRGGDLIEDVKYTEVRFNTKPADAAFAKPEGFEEQPFPAPPPPTRETKLADGVYLFESAANSLVVEFDTYVLVVEPYGGGRGPKPTINKAREMFPSKPVKYVVVTHYHDDHSGGLRSYVANGVAVVTTPANQKFFERMAAGSFTLNPDDQTRAPRPPQFEFVRDRRRVFTDGKQTVEVIDIGPSPHAEEMLVVYLPKEKLVFQGDLVNLPFSGKYLNSTVNDTTLHFFDAVSRLKLDVKRVAAVHGPSTTWDDLREAVEKKRAGR
ncbi:MAG TPA: MBL fold metallo-hydrolase [Pyrinomonadaceae bacterium]|jgi:glyoxylase-like metal-dependent hydrolase (beta-lactamase superfamily II)|nr:MBL fold metallo-hydrolase [Pyrinomonadaceae bacterium]